MRRALCSFVVLSGCSGSSAMTDGAPPAPLTLDKVGAQIDLESADNAQLAVNVTVDTGGADPSGLSAELGFRGGTMALTRNDLHFGTLVTADGGLVDDEPVTVTFTLDGATATAMVTMPAGFTVTSVSGTPMSPPLTIMWSPVRTDPMHWEASGYAPSNHQCTVFPPMGDPNFADTGTLTIDDGFTAVGGNGCSIGFGIYRTRTGTVTNLGAGSYIHAAQERNGLSAGA